MPTDPDRLTTAPRQAVTCSNCRRPMLPPRCVCGWVDPDSEPLLTMDDTGEFPALVVDPPGGSD